MRLPPDPTDTFRLLDVEVATTGRDFVLLYSRRTRETRLVPTATALLLQQCQTFRTLDEHAHAEAGDFAANRRALEDLAVGGFLVSTGELIERCRRTTTQNHPPPISIIGIPTRDRVELLQRTILSGQENLQRHGRNARFMVMDDASSRANQTACRHLLQELSRQTGTPMEYAGQPEKEQFAQALAAEADCDPSLLHFALFDDGVLSYSGGANRNALLLASVGENLLHLDDDLVCRLAEIPAYPSDRPLSFCGGVRQEKWFFPDRESAWRQARFVEKDMLGLHEEFLGKDLGQCLQGRPLADLDFLPVDGAFSARLGCGRGRIRVSFLGHLGDPGISHQQISLYLTYTGKTFARLTQSEAAYRTAMESREVLCGVTKRTIGAGSPCTGMNMGWDNSTLLPPFFPFGRGEDTTWGMILWTCSPESYFAHIPYALCHVPDPQKRTFSKTETWRDPPLTSFAEFLSRLVFAYNWRPNHLSFPERLKAFGQHLVEFEAVPPAEFNYWMREQIWCRHAQQMEYLAKRLQEEHDEPKYWAADAQFHLQQLRAMIQQSEIPVPYQLGTQQTLAEAQAITQAWLGKFGRLLQIWPEVVAAALRLKARGQTLAQPVGS